MRLGITQGGDAFRALGEDEDDPTLEGAVLPRRCGSRVPLLELERRAERTAITDDTEKAFLIIESVDPARIDDVRRATDELAELLGKHLDATVFAKGIVTKDNPRW